MNAEERIMILNIGVRLAEIRKEKGIKQIDACSKAGILVNHLSRIENGNTAPSITDLIKLCKLYRIELNDVYTCLDDREQNREAITRELNEKLEPFSDRELAALLTVFKRSDRQPQRVPEPVQKDRWETDMEI